MRQFHLAFPIRDSLRPEFELDTLPQVNTHS